MLTAFGQEDVTKKAVELGASYFILKPFDMENLGNHIRQVSGNSSSVTRKAYINRIIAHRLNKNLKISMQALQALFMKLVCQRILKDICIYVKQFQWFIMILNY